MAHATAPTHGKYCRVETGGVQMDYSKGWTINVALDMADASRAGQHWKEALPGQTGWSGTFEAHYVMGNTEQAAFYDNLIVAIPGVKLTTVRFTLDVVANYYAGNVFITGADFNGNIGDVVSSTISFQGDGALSVTP